jgi:hypothetical protein
LGDVKINLLLRFFVLQSFDGLLAFAFEKGILALLVFFGGMSDAVSPAGWQKNGVDNGFILRINGWPNQIVSKHISSN